MRRAALAAAVIALGVSGCGDSAPSDVYLRTPAYTKLAFPEKPHRAFAFRGVVLHNEGRRPVTLRDVRIESSSGLSLLGAEVLGPRRPAYTSAGGFGWPSAGYHISPKPLRGYVVQGRSNVLAILKLRATAGHQILRRISVDYSVGGNDYTMDHRLGTAVCVSDPINPHCHVPRGSEIG
jgi:hypothetical protein